MPSMPRCPRCGGEIVYNGNYFCSSYAIEWCGWALSDNQRNTSLARTLIDGCYRGEVRKVHY